MDDSSHLQVYRRFFATLLSVVPGLVLVYAVFALIMWIVGDLAGLEMGWGLGFAAIGFVITGAVWIFVGMGVQSWAADKPVGLLAGLSSPFILVVLAFMGWLFYETVIDAHAPGGEEEGAARAVQVDRLPS